ncbi:MAG: hypothetical protein AABZ60_16615 [Planctomycetota bacterium]
MTTVFFLRNWIFFEESWEPFVSLYPEMLNKFHLGIFLLLLLFFFMGRATFRNRALKKARQRLPLTIGGWGTRGKSGTERLKAAMFHEMGYTVFSKTTGCDAMFLHNGPLAELQEFYLFRPYEKSSIWEQRDCVLLAEKLHTEVFLWECMALNPLYAELLQEDWMKDAVSTLTNAYPDHEDIQGPAGVNVAQSLAHFIPKNTALVTTEEQMLPILEQKAKEKGSRIYPVSWRNTYFLPDDILQRLPYQEHPSNMALVTELGTLLGIPKERIWKSFGEHLIPDLGGLKTFGPISYRHRTLKFINGMSANERLGSIGNWNRCELNQIHPLQNRGVWVVTVVNNRSDRIARSKIFSQMLIEEMFAHRHFMIGTNLSGFKSYVQQGFKKVYRYWRPPFDSEESFHAWLCLYKIPYFPIEEVIFFLKSMLSGCQNVALFEHFSSLANLHNSLSKIQATHPSLTEKDATEKNEALQELLKTLHQTLHGHLPEDLVQDILRFWEESIRIHGSLQKFWKQWKEHRDENKARSFFQRLLLYTHSYLENPNASGEALIEYLTTRVPPGFQVIIMGIQNIKQRTSMEFVHSWIASELLEKKLLPLKEKNEALQQTVLRWLETFEEWNLFTSTLALQSLKSVSVDSSILQETVEKLTSKIRLQHQACLDRSQTSESLGLGDYLLNTLEKILDVTDAKRRRKLTWKLYHEFVEGRISHRKLAYLLQNLMHRQKGGWLKEASD